MAREYCQPGLLFYWLPYMPQLSPGEGMGVEFTNVGPQARVLLDEGLKRLLQ